MKPSAYKAYFEAIANSHTGVQSFLYADLNRILSRNPSGYKYPLLVVERPSIKVFENSVEQCRGAFVVIMNPKYGDTADSIACEDTTEEIAQDIISKIWKDKKDGVIVEFIPSTNELEPIDTLTIDGDVGWRFEFFIQDVTGTGLCYNPTKWN